MSRVFTIEVEPRYMLFNKWKIMKFEKLPLEIQKLYRDAGINGWMGKNIDAAFYKERNIYFTGYVINSHKMTFQITVLPDSLLNYKSLFNGKDWQKDAICHCVEQKTNTGRDWAYGVNRSAIIKDEKNKEAAVMVFHINKIKENIQK